MWKGPASVKGMTRCFPVQAQHASAMAEDMEDDFDLTEEEAADLAAIKARKKQIVLDHRLKKGSANNQVRREQVWTGGDARVRSEDGTDIQATPHLPAPNPPFRLPAYLTPPPPSLNTSPPPLRSPDSMCWILFFPFLASNH